MTADRGDRRTRTRILPPIDGGDPDFSPRGFVTVSPTSRALSPVQGEGQNFRPHGGVLSKARTEGPRAARRALRRQLRKANGARSREVRT